MNITIAGSGNVGRALAAGWLKTGHNVTFATREAAGDKAGELRKEGFGVAPLDDAATGTDVIVLAVPWTAVEVTIKSLGAFAGKILIDATDPLKSRRELVIGFGDSGGETVARLAPSALVVKAFSTTGSGNMADSKYPGGKLMMALAGDDAAAKKIVMALVTDLVSTRSTPAGWP